MRNFLFLLALLLVRPAMADAPVEIFRVDTDNPGHGSFGGNNAGIQNFFTCYRGTVWIQNTSGTDLTNVKIHVTLYNRRQHVNDNSAEYVVGTFGASQILSQNFKIYAASDAPLVPLVRVTYELNGTPGEQKTQPSDSYY